MKSLINGITAQRNVQRFLSSILLAALLGSLAGQAVQVRAADLPFQAGEKLAYRISWSNFMEAGKAELAVTQTGPGSPTLYRFLLIAATTPAISTIYPFKDEFSSLYDTAAGAPSHFEKRFVERKRVVRETVDFDQFGRLAAIAVPRKPVQKVPIELGTQDPVSALYLIRTLNFKPGLQISFPVLDGGKIYLLDLHVAGTDLISTQAGSFNTYRIEIRLRREGLALNDKRITLWLSNDAKRLPVLIAVNLSLGSALIELTSMSN